MTTTNAKPSGPVFQTDKLEVLAHQIFNGALPRLSGNCQKRRAQLAKEFTAAHLKIPGFSQPDPAKLAALDPTVRAIADSRQARVDAYLASLPEPVSLASVRQRLVASLGERAIVFNLMHAKQQIAAALVLVSALEGEAPGASLGTSGASLVSKLDKLLGADARQQCLPRGTSYPLDNLRLLSDLASALIDARAASATPKATQAPRAPAPRAQSTKPAAKASGLMTRSAFNTLSPFDRMTFAKSGGRLVE